MKRSLKQARLYLVLDARVQSYAEMMKVLRQAVRAGVQVIQMRDKDSSAKDILKFTQQALQYIHGRIPFIVNDRLDIAKAVGAQGVHLGQEDLPVAVARKIVGLKMIIGASCQTLAQAKKAQEDGADYIGFGSVFKTLTKPERAAMNLDLLARVVRDIRIPVFAIGGINGENAAQLRALGVNRVAVTRSISLADNVTATVKRFHEVLFS